MSEQENIKAAQAWISAWNMGDLGTMTEFEADNFMADNPGSPPTNSAQTRAYIKNFMTAFPGSKIEVLLTVAQGDYVVTNWKTTAKNAGPLMSPSGATVPPTGKMVTTLGSTTSQLKNGKVLHTWGFFDMAALLGQMGLMPPM